MYAMLNNIHKSGGISKRGSNSLVFQNIQIIPNEDLPCDPVVKNPPSNVRDVGSIPAPIYTWGN